MFSRHDSIQELPSAPQHASFPAAPSRVACLPEYFMYYNYLKRLGTRQALGVSSDQYGSLLTPIIMAKLPNDIRLGIARKSASGVWKIDELLNTILRWKHGRQVKQLRQVPVAPTIKEIKMVIEVVSKIQQQLHCLQHKVA